jgi:diacylglycerol kinase
VNNLQNSGLILQGVGVFIAFFEIYRTSKYALPVLKQAFAKDQEFRMRLLANPIVMFVAGLICYWVGRALS